MRPSTDTQSARIPKRHFHLQCQIILGHRQTANESSDYKFELLGPVVEGAGKARSNPEI